MQNRTLRILTGHFLDKGLVKLMSSICLTVFRSMDETRMYPTSYSLIKQLGFRHSNVVRSKSTIKVKSIQTPPVVGAPSFAQLLISSQQVTVITKDVFNLKRPPEKLHENRG